MSISSFIYVMFFDLLCMFVLKNFSLAMQFFFKVENLLFDSCGFVKLCDFGSATTETFQPDDLWSALQRTQLEEEVHS